MKILDNTVKQNYRKCFEYSEITKSKNKYQSYSMYSCFFSSSLIVLVFILCFSSQMLQIKLSALPRQSTTIMKAAIPK